jgi:predicted enzyme related to lactoylglutathione lyase
VSTTTTGIDTIGLVMIPSPDQDRAIAFYESIGFEKRTDIPFGGSYRWVEMYPPTGNTGIALAPPREQDPVGIDTGISLSTADIEATYADMKGKGIDVDAQISRMGDPVPPMFWFRDSHANTLLVVQTTA